MRTFRLHRVEDPSGVSGVGDVAAGVVLPTGRVVLEWSVDVRSIVIYGSVAEVEQIHGHGGKTQVVWDE